MNNEIFPATLAMEALKYGPYKDTSFALAELVDNSVDADANAIGVAVISDGPRQRPHTIAVLDNGCGMSIDTLKHCIQYGYTKDPKTSPRPLRKSSRRSNRRLGRFGVGLVAASLSQCSDLQVMSWQNREASSKSVPSTRLSLDTVRSTGGNILPEVSSESFPSWVETAFQGMPDHITEMNSGTLVVWRNVETSNVLPTTLRDKFLRLVGRVHRGFIARPNGRLQVTVSIVDVSSGNVEPEEAQPVDPTFLSNWNTPDLADHGIKGNRTLFQPYTGHPGDSARNNEGEYEPELHEVRNPNTNEVVGCYLLQPSYRADWVVNDERLSERYKDPGDAPYGKLAGNLKGVSIMRAEREIVLDPGWLRPDRTVDRWISVSVDFDPELDQVIGVTNDKQQVRRLTDLASKSRKDIQDEMRERGNSGNTEEWEYHECLRIALVIRERLDEMAKLVKAQRSGTRGGITEFISTDPTLAPTHELVQQGTRLATGERKLPMDIAEPSSNPSGTREVYGESLSGDGLARESRPQEVIRNNLQLDFVRDRFGTSTTMFRASVGPGHMVVHFHEQHPLSSAMAALLVDDNPDEDNEARPDVLDALRIIRGLVGAYARMQVEAERYDPGRAAQMQHDLTTWSEIANRLFREDDD